MSLSLKFGWNLMGFGWDIGLWTVLMNMADEQAVELHADEHGWCTQVHLVLV